MWWYGLVVWGVWEIVFFCFCLLGVWEIVIFCLQSSGRMFANRPLALFSPPPLQKAVSGCWTYMVLVQKHPLTHQCLPPLQSKRRSAGVVHRPCTETPTDPPMFPPPSSPKGRWSAGVGRTSSLYRSTRWPTNVSPPPLQKVVCRCWTYIVLVQKHPLTHQCLSPLQSKRRSAGVGCTKHLLAASPTWSVRPAGPARAYVLVLCKHPLKFSCGRASTSSRQARFSQCYNENPRGSDPKFKDENLAALQMNMLVTRPFVVLGPADWCAPIFGSNLICSSPTVAYHLRKKKYWCTVTSILGMSSWSCLITAVCWALTRKELAKKHPQLRWNWETGPEKKS